MIVYYKLIWNLELFSSESNHSTIILIIISDIFKTTSACLDSVATLTCSNGGTITTLFANMGRTDSVTCAGNSPGSRCGNSNTDTLAVKAACDGRATCTIQAAWVNFGGTDTCTAISPATGTVGSYLYIAYGCYVKIASNSNTQYSSIY